MTKICNRQSEKKKRMSFAEEFELMTKESGYLDGKIAEMHKLLNR